MKEIKYESDFSQDLEYAKSYDSYFKRVWLLLTREKNNKIAFFLTFFLIATGEKITSLPGHYFAGLFGSVFGVSMQALWGREVIGNFWSSKKRLEKLTEFLNQELDMNFSMEELKDSELLELEKAIYFSEDMEEEEFDELVARLEEFLEEERNEEVELILQYADSLKITQIIRYFGLLDEKDQVQVIKQIHHKLSTCGVSFWESNELFLLEQGEYNKTDEEMLEINQYIRRRKKK